METRCLKGLASCVRNRPATVGAHHSGSLAGPMAAGQTVRLRGPVSIAPALGTHFGQNRVGPRHDRDQLGGQGAQDAVHGQHEVPIDRGPAQEL